MFLKQTRLHLIIMNIRKIISKRSSFYLILPTVSLLLYQLDPWLYSWNFSNMSSSMFGRILMVRTNTNLFDNIAFEISVDMKLPI